MMSCRTDDDVMQNDDDVMHTNRRGIERSLGMWVYKFTSGGAYSGSTRVVETFLNYATHVFAPLALGEGRRISHPSYGTGF